MHTKLAFLPQQWLAGLGFALALSACGAPPTQAITAQRHLSRGDYQAADKAADQALISHPKDPTSWRIKIRAAMGQGDLSYAAAVYEEWKQLRSGHDAVAYRLMAITTVWQGLQVPSDDICAKAIQIAERHEIEKLADDVRARLGDDSDLVAAAAAAALLTSHPAAPRIGVELLSSSDPRARAIVVRSIGTKVGRHARADLLPALKDSTPQVRRAAIDAFSRWKNPEDRSLLIKAAKSDVDGQVRSRALRGLAEIGGPGVVEVAMQSLTDSYLGARVAAVHLLGKQGGTSATETLTRLAQQESDYPVALRAAVALHKNNNTDMRATVKRAYAAQDWSTRAAALNATADAAPRKFALEFGGRGMADARLEVRLTAARMLLRLGVTESPLAALHEALGADQLTPRLIAATDLARRGSEEAIELLSRMARTGSPEQRTAAITAHAAAGVVSDGLVASLADESIATRLAAANALLSL